MSAVISGQVFAPDGKTPARDVIVYAYQTDATGQYHNDVRGVARLHGWAKTDADGRLEFRTIRPAQYPSGGVAAHVHFHIYGGIQRERLSLAGGYRLQWTPELLFKGDSQLSPREVRESEALGDKFANIRPLTRGADGVQHCTINFSRSKETNYPNRGDPRTR